MRRPRGETRDALNAGGAFGWESTLSGRVHARLLRKAKASAYEIELHTPGICIERVAQRVREGGHNVPIVDIRRRFDRSIRNLVDVYLELADRWTIWDATTTKPLPVLHSSQSSASAVRSIPMP